MRRDGRNLPASQPALDGTGGRVTHVGMGLTVELIIAAMVYATGHLSGAHLNPAVTLGFMLARPTWNFSDL